jgi:phage-related protein
MKNKWNIVYYTYPDGYCPIKEFIDSVKDSNKAKIFALLGYLGLMGPHLPRPYADIVSDGIHELRIKLSGSQIRILYFFYLEENIILTNTFTKNTVKIPKRELNKAKAIRSDYISRIDTH